MRKNKCAMGTHSEHQIDKISEERIYFAFSHVVPTPRIASYMSEFENLSSPVQ